MTTPGRPSEMKLLGLISSEGCDEPNGRVFLIFNIFAPDVKLCDAVFRSLVTAVTL